MKPVEFKEKNVVFGEGQPEYLPLPAFKNHSELGEVITCWELSFWERIRILFLGKIWLNMITFNKPLMPVYLTTKKEEVLGNESQ